jgi:flagellar motor protein MotB
MFRKFLRRLTVRDASASRIAFVATKWPVKRDFTSNDDGHGWMVTLSDLTFALLGFLLVWSLLDKNSLNATHLAAASAEITQKPIVRASSDPIHLSRGAWQTLKEEMQRFVAEMGLAQEVRVESTANEIVISLNDTVPFVPGKDYLRQEAIPLLQKLLAVVLSNETVSLEVSSRTDNISFLNSRYPSARGLSAVRASRVARYLMDNGFDSSRVSVRDYFSQSRRAPSSVENQIANHRRVEIRVYRGVDQSPFVRR